MHRAALAVSVLVGSAEALCALSTNASLSQLTDSSKVQIVKAKVTAISAGRNFRYEAATKVKSYAYTGITLDQCFHNFHCKISPRNAHKT